MSTPKKKTRTKPKKATPSAVEPVKKSFFDEFIGPYEKAMRDEEAESRKTSRELVHAEPADKDFSADKFADRIADVAINAIDEIRKSKGLPPLKD